MKCFRQLLTLCAALAALGGGLSSSWAADAPGKKAAPPDLVLKGDAKCTSCHDEADAPQVLHIGKTRHGVKADGRTPTCTSCHGESENHMKTAKAGGKNKPTPPDVTFGKKSQNTAEERSSNCLSCHDGENRTHWSGSQHQTRDVACNSCHQVHTQNDSVMKKTTQGEVCFSCHKTERAQIHRMSTHPIAAGKVACSDCHNPHGSAGPKLVLKNTINETCYTCHAEKRGPFLWEHPPASDDCMNCHTPHGSTNAGLLRMRSPWLCQRCHSDGAPHPGAVYSGANLPGGTVNIINNPATTATAGIVNPLTGLKTTQTQPANQMALRGCSNCHSQVHGSNHPAGMWFAR